MSRGSVFGALDFDDIDPYGQKGWEETASGSATLYSLHSILPDPKQPRRLLPSDLTNRVALGKMSPNEAVVEWGNRAGAAPNSRTAQEYSKLVQLADSISQHGLINPITIQAVPGGAAPYRIVTGERRYWAHVLLDQEEKPVFNGQTGQIAASLADDNVSIRAHQMVENWHREDVSLVEKANGLWALRYDLSGVTSEESSRSKLVTWKEVEKSLGISRQHRIRLLKVLDLPNEAIQLVEDYDLAEATIRPILHNLAGRPDMQMAALEQVAAWSNEDTPLSLKDVKALVDKVLQQEAETIEQPGSTDKTAALHNRTVRRFRTRIGSALKLANKLPLDELREEMTKDEALRRQVSELQTWLKEALS